MDRPSSKPNTAKPLLRRRIAMPYQGRILTTFSPPSDKSRAPYPSQVGRLELVLSLIDRDGYQCGICLGILPDEWSEIDVDHIKPKVLGGSHQLVNLRLTHKFCNRSKAKEFKTYNREQAAVGRIRGLETRQAKARARAEVARRLRRKGHTMRQIAKKLQCSVGTIHTYLSK